MGETDHPLRLDVVGESEKPSSLTISAPTCRQNLNRRRCPPDLQSSTCPPTSTSIWLQRAYRPPYLHVDKRAVCLQSSGASYLHTSMLPRLHTSSAPPDLLSSMLPRLHACSARPELHASTSLRLQRASRPPNLHASTSAHLERTSSTPYIHTSTSTRLQSASRGCCYLQSLVSPTRRRHRTATRPTDRLTRPTCKARSEPRLTLP